MVDAAVPITVWHRRMISSVHMIREPRAQPATALTSTHWRVSFTTSHMRWGMRPRVTRRFSRVCSIETSTNNHFSCACDVSVSIGRQHLRTASGRGV